MSQKTISLNAKAYQLLKKHKKAKESFSELIIRLCHSQEKHEKEDLLLKYAGVFEENSEFWEKAEQEIQQERDDHLISEEED